MGFFIFIIIVIVGTLLGLVGKGIRDRKWRIIQGFREESQRINRILREAGKADSVTNFLTCWENLKEAEDNLAYYKKKISNKSIKEEIKETYQLVKEKDNDFQWMMCNAIERMKKNAIKDIKNTFKYSDVKKRQMVSFFRYELEQGNDYFSNYTRKVADEMLEEVALVAGQTATPVRNLTKQRNANNSENLFSHSGITEKDIDNMDGHQFEYFCAELLRRNGFEDVRVTKGSGDQGVDILAEKDEIKYAIQCKCFSSELGNKPIQEAYAGKSIYRCQVAAVLTNQYFTQGAIDAAKATGVLLWDRNKLLKLISNTQN